MLLGSCGELDLDTEEQITVVDFSFDDDTLYVEVGDRFTVPTVFMPDTISIENIFWMSDADSVVHVEADTLTALSPGWSCISAISVSRRIADSCYVCVMPKWNVDMSSFPYEMIIYAEVSVGGKPLDDTYMTVGAFCYDELRGIGHLRNEAGKTYIEIRVGSDERYDEEYPEYITFICYDKRNHRCFKASDRLKFDGESYGTLSNLYPLHF